MVVMMDLDQNLFPQQQALVLLLPLIIFMSFNIDVGVAISDSLSSQGRRGRSIHDSHVGRACNDCNGSTICIYYILNRKLQPDSNVLRITYSTRHERKPRLGMKPRLQDGTVMVDTDKYRLVGIPPSSREPPDVGLTRIC